MCERKRERKKIIIDINLQSKKFDGSIFIDPLL